ncbi:WW domain-containing protein [Aphelenchoides besseyi]|nr:WW domain-containing protein [Aphelenchoides besseyi]
MPLPAALLQRLQKRGIVPKAKDDEEVFIESYDGAAEDADEKDEQTRPRSGAPGCPNRWNEFHLCTDFCYDHWQEGMPESRLSERYQQAKRTMLARYPLPDGWKEVYDAGVRRHYYWCPSTDEVCWLSPNHPLANITEAGPQVAKRNFAENKRHSQVDEVAEEHGNKRQRGKERNRKPEVNVSDNDDEDGVVEKRAKATEGHSRDESNFNLAARNTEVEISDRDRMKKALKKKMDPMDPASYSDAPAGNWSTGLTSEAKTGVDVTATGPLFQSRPYPNPGTKSYSTQKRAKWFKREVNSTSSSKRSYVSQLNLHYYLTLYLKTVHKPFEYLKTNRSSENTEFEFTVISRATLHLVRLALIFSASTMFDFVALQFIGFIVGFAVWNSMINCSKKKTPTITTAPVNAPKASELKPQVIPKNEKEQLIARGALKNRHDYPTMDDVVSDWETEEEGPDGVNNKKKKKIAKGKPKAVDPPKEPSKVMDVKTDGTQKPEDSVP